MSSISCVIPARIGSKRIPNKNIIDFFGKPLLSYAIKTAINSGIFSRVIVTTDSIEISSIAEKYGAESSVLRRDNFDDHSTIESAILSAIQDYEVNDEYVACLFATSILLKPHRIQEAYMKIRQNNYDSLITVKQFEHPIERSLVMGKEGVEWVDPKYAETRTQDLVSKYYDAGQFYISKRSTLLKFEDFLAKKCTMIVLNGLESIDIDTYEDLELARKIYADYQ